MTDLSKSFEKLKDTMYTKYKGCLILNDPVGSYTWGGHSFLSLEGAKAAIDAAFVSADKSINRLK